jgi:hypothetical protein
VPPNIRVYEECYVILHLDELCNWHFLPQNYSLLSEKDCTKKYRGAYNIVESDRSAVPMPGGKPGTAPGLAMSRLMFFAVTQLDWYTAGTVDRCNLFVQFNLGPTHWLPVVIDPDIKNDGGNPVPI